MTWVKWEENPKVFHIGARVHHAQLGYGQIMEVQLSLRGYRYRVEFQSRVAIWCKSSELEAEVKDDKSR